MKVATPQGTPPSPVKVILPLSCYVNLQEKRKTFPLSGTAHRLPHFPSDLPSCFKQGTPYNFLRSLVL
jgi:hypothetical protein